MGMMQVVLFSAAAAALGVDKTPAARKRLKRDLTRLDGAYQRFVQQSIDPLFAARERRAQLRTYAGQVDPQERSVNRTLAFSALTTITAGVGALGLPLLSTLSAVGLTVVITPLMWRAGGSVIRERKLKYRLVRLMTIPLALLSGFTLLINVMTFVFLATYKVAARTKAAAHDSMRDAFRLQPPQEVWVEVDGVQVQIPFNELQAGDIIVIGAGQAIPVDGAVVGGSAAVDQQIMTGEARPVDKDTGDQALANTLIIRGELRIRVEKTGDDTAAAQIADILVSASESRLRAADFSERLLDNLTLPMMATSGAALATVGPSGAIAIFNGGFATTALMSGPLCMLSYLNLASQNGILIKDGRSLETLRGVTAMIFDKTGTLTTEEPRVAFVHAADPFDEETVLRYAALAEHRQTHPIARAILAAAEVAGCEIDAPDEASYAMGLGVEVESDGRLIRVGSARFMATSGVDTTRHDAAWLAESEAVGGSLVFVAVDDDCAGALRLEAQLREETETLIQDLHRRKIKTYILSGDHRAPTEHLANALGVTGFFAEVMPDGKETIVQRLRSEGEIVCFVGDGLNDALALQAADVSISMRGATSVATDSAQIVLMSASLQPIEMLLDLGKAFHSNLLRTMVFGYTPGVVLIGGVFLFGLGMPAAFIAYTASMAGGALSALSPPRLPSAAKLVGSSKATASPPAGRSDETPLPKLDHIPGHIPPPDITGIKR